MVNGALAANCADAAAPAVAFAWNVMLGTHSSRRAPPGMRTAGNASDNSGRASTAAAAAIHTKCRTAAVLPRSSQAARLAAASTAELFSATPIRNENAVIYWPSFLARSIMAAMRPSSSSVSRAADTSSSAATIFSGEPAKKVSITCFTADRLALFRGTTGK